jgi:hypothetical protein
MIKVNRALNVAELESLLNKIRPDDPFPRIIVDTNGTALAEPEYTIIWNQAQIDPN